MGKRLLHAFQFAKLKGQQWDEEEHWGHVIPGTTSDQGVSTQGPARRCTHAKRRNDRLLPQQPEESPVSQEKVGPAKHIDKPGGIP